MRFLLWEFKDVKFFSVLVYSLIFNIYFTPQNVITIDAKCKILNAKCNNFLMQNVITFLTHTVTTQNVISKLVWCFEITIITQLRLPIAIR